MIGALDTSSDELASNINSLFEPNDIDCSIDDISKLLNLLKDIPELNDDLKRRIVFALEYFLEEQDEIPDDSPDIGLLDDYVLVRWVVDNIMADYTEVYKA